MTSRTSFVPRYHCHSHNFDDLEDLVRLERLLIAPKYGSVAISMTSRTSFVPRYHCHSHNFDDLEDLVRLERLLIAPKYGSVAISMTSRTSFECRTGVRRARFRVQQPAHFPLIQGFCSGVGVVSSSCCSHQNQFIVSASSR